MYVDLIEKLTEIDKKRIENYILTYGTSEGFMGVDKWLQNWSHSNQKLYKLLGGNLIVKKPIKMIKSQDLIARQFKDLIQDSSVLDTILVLDSKYRAKRVKDNGNLDNDVYVASGLTKVVNELADGYSFSIDCYIKDAIDFSAKIVAPYSGKTFQIQKGMKPVKALRKVIDFYKAEFTALSESNNYLLKCIDDEFEVFRIKASMIFNDKYITGNLCFSIHPLDYMTMSDNSLDWSSCMSWTSKGCYRVGTIEMMNSNNAICCYLESSELFYFKKEIVNYTYKEETLEKSKEELKKMKDACGPEYTWNNKKWRVLVYANKDIIMTGKSYPYYNEDLDKEILSTLVDLAGSNLSWHYQFGPELYLDMKHITSKSSFDINRRWIRYGDTTKHNIIWDTHGMYNDMLNANKYSYWCYRNRVNHNKIYSVSGKATCLCCGNNIIYDNEDNENDYNERFCNTGATICEDCANDFYNCDICSSVSCEEEHYIVKIDGKRLRVCAKCFDALAVRCPCCGKPIWAQASSEIVGYREITKLPVYIPRTATLYHVPMMPSASNWRKWQSYLLVEKPRRVDTDGYPILEYLFMCNDCLKKFSENNIFKLTVPVHYGWYRDREERQFNIISNDCHVNEFYYHDPGIVEKACYRNLECIKPPKPGDAPIEFEYVGSIRD